MASLVFDVTSVVKRFEVLKKPDVNYARTQIGLGAFRRLIDFGLTYLGNKDFKGAAPVGAFCAVYDIFTKGSFTISAGRGENKFSLNATADLIGNMCKVVLYSRVFNFSKGLSEKYVPIVEFVQDVADITTAVYFLKGQWEEWETLCSNKESASADRLTRGYQLASAASIRVFAAQIVMTGIFALACMTASICNLVIRAANFSARIGPYTGWVNVVQGGAYKLLIAMTVTTEIAKFYLKSYDFHKVG